MRSDRRQHGNRYFARVLASLLLFSFAIIVALSYIFTTISRENLFEQISSEHVSGMNRAGNSVEAIVRGARQLYIVLNTDEDVYIFLNATSADPVNMIRARIKASKIKQVNAAVESMHLINGVTREMIAVGTPFPAFDAELLASIDTQRHGSALKALRLTNAAKREMPILSMLFCDSTMNGASISSAIAINLNAETVLADAMVPQNDTVFAADAEGMLMLHSDPAMVGKSVAGAEPFASVLRAGADSGSLILTLDGSSQIVSFHRNAGLGLWFVMTRPYESITGAIVAQRNRVIFVSLMVLLAAGLLGLMIAQRLYSPIGVVVKTIRNYYNQPHPPGRGKDELREILSAFESSLARIRQLQQKNIEDAHKLKQERLRRHLIDANLPEDENGELARQALEVDAARLYVAVVLMDAYRSIDAEQRRVFQTAARALIRDELSKDFACEVVDIHGGEIAVLLSPLRADRIDRAQRMRRLAQLQAVIWDALQMGVTIAGGDQMGEWPQVRRAYESAKSLAKYRFVLGRGRIIDAELVESAIEPGAQVDAGLEEKLVAAMHMGRRTEFGRLLDELISALRRGTYSDAMLGMLRLMTTLTKDVGRISGRSTLAFMWIEEIVDMEVIEESREWVESIFDEYQTVAAEMAKMGDDRHTGMVEQIKHYIEEHFGDADLSAEMLADVAGYSPNYFARLFKDTTGVYVADYIRQVRIGEAKKLLAGSKLKMREISEQIGFLNSNYFYSSFKREVGLTPASFRAMAQKQHSEGEGDA